MFGYDARTWLLAVFLLAAVILVAYLWKRKPVVDGGPTAIPAPPGGRVTKHTELVARVINNLDWNARSCDSGRWLLSRLAAQALTKGPFACEQAAQVLNVGAVVSAFPGTNEVTRLQLSKDLTALVLRLADEACVDGALTGQQLADAINATLKETCDARVGTLLQLYIPPTSKMPLPL